MDIMEKIKSVDKNNMYQLITSIPRELEKSFKKYSRLSLPREIVISGVRRSIENIDKVVLIGMGGSAIGSDIIYYYLYDSLRLSVTIVRDFMIPGFIDENTLLISVSYSGETNETLYASIECIKRGVYPIFITSNGTLEKLARKINAPIYLLPKGRPPRTSIAYMISALLDIFNKIDIARFDEEELMDAVKYLENLVEKHTIFNEENVPLNIAKQLREKIPLIYAYKPYTPLGFRFKTQLNENAKHHAFFAELPEANHNEIMGWENELKGKYIPVLIRGSKESSYIRVVIDFWKEIFRDIDLDYIQIIGEGPNLLAELLSILIICDLTSFLLAIIKGVDPTPVSTISRLKKYVEAETRLKEKIDRLIDNL